MAKELPNFRSKFEGTVYAQAKENGRQLEYEPPSSTLSYTHTAEYHPDFELPSGVLVECKGYFSPADRRKMRRVRGDNPERDIRFLFQRANNRLTKSKRSITYGQWAERHGFEWAEGTIPESWF